MNAQKVKMDSLVTEGLQIRCAMNEDTIAEYAEAMKDGAMFPPIIVFEEVLADAEVVLLHALLCVLD